MLSISHQQLPLAYQTCSSNWLKNVAPDVGHLRSNQSCLAMGNHTKSVSHAELKYFVRPFMKEARSHWLIQATLHCLTSLFAAMRSVPHLGNAQATLLHCKLARHISESRRL